MKVHSHVRYWRINCDHCACARKPRCIIVSATQSLHAIVLTLPTIRRYSGPLPHWVIHDPPETRQHTMLARQFCATAKFAHHARLLRRHYVHPRIADPLLERYRGRGPHRTTPRAAHRRTCRINNVVHISLFGHSRQWQTDTPTHKSQARSSMSASGAQPISSVHSRTIHTSGASLGSRLPPQHVSVLAATSAFAPRCSTNMRRVVSPAAAARWRSHKIAQQYGGNSASASGFGGSRAMVSLYGYQVPYWYGTRAQVWSGPQAGGDRRGDFV
jgi:hypothetical protein